MCRSTRRPSGRIARAMRLRWVLITSPRGLGAGVRTIAHMCGKREPVQSSTSKAQRPTFQLRRIGRRRWLPLCQIFDVQSRALNVRREAPLLSGVLVLLLPDDGNFFPSTTARLIVTSAMSAARDMIHDVEHDRSSMERSARAPVPFVTACARGRAMRLCHESDSFHRKSLVYCLIIAFFVSVRIITISSSVSASSA